jgi:hypothetical protein
MTENCYELLDTQIGLFRNAKQHKLFNRTTLMF